MQVFAIAAFLQLLLIALWTGDRRPDPVSYLPVGIALMGVTMAAMTLVHA